MYSKTAQRLNKLSYQNVLNLFLQLLNNILYFSFRKLIVYYKYYILMKKKFFEKKSEFKCDYLITARSNTQPVIPSVLMMLLTVANPLQVKIHFFQNHFSLA